MPRIDGGRGGSGRKPYVLPKGPRGDAPQQRQPAPKPKAKRRYVLPRAPSGRGDAPQQRKQDAARAEQHKAKPTYRKAVKQAYRTRPIAERRQRLRELEGKARRGITLSREDRAVWARHLWSLDSLRDALNTQVFSDRMRYRVERNAKTPAYRDALDVAREDVDFRTETDPQKLRAAGFREPGFLEGLVESPKYALGAIASLGAVGEAAYLDPVGVPLKTGKQAAMAVPAIFGGLYALATDPVDTITEGAQAFAERSTQPFDERVKAIRAEGGFEYLADGTLVLGAAGSATRLLRRGHDSDRAARRDSGGAAAQRRGSRGMVVSAAQDALDRKRAAKLEAELQAAEDGGKAMSAVRREAALANRKAGRVVEVVTAGNKRRQVRGIAKLRGRAVYGLKRDQGHRIKQAEKEINRLDRKEKRALYYAAALGIRTPEQARELLADLHEHIEAYRASHNVKVTGLLKKSDMLPDIEKILADPERHFTARLAEVIEALRPDSMRAGREDPSLDTRTRLTRRRKPQAQLLGLERRDGESALDFTKRTRVAAELADLDLSPLAAPLYFLSERYVGPREFAAHAVGGRRAMKGDKQYKGDNLAVGLQDTSPDVYLRGLARNVKRKHNWSLVADLLEANAIRSLSSGPGLPLSALRAKAVAAGIDLASIAFVSPTIFRAVAKRADKAKRSDDLGASEDFDARLIESALAESKVDGDATAAAHLENSPGWRAVPLAVLRELEAETTPSSMAGRSLDIVKGKLSRAILMTGNIPWQLFNLVSDSAMAAVTTRGGSLNPANWLGASRWWNQDLTPEDRVRVGGIIGLDATGADSKQIKLGATTNSDLVNAYRALKASPIFHAGVVGGRGPALSDLNPLEVMALLDRKRSNSFRILAGYSLAKREAVHRMGEDMAALDRAQARVTSILQRPPADQMRALARDRDALEDMGDAISDFMGDYTTLTAFERKVVNRWTMWFPFLRYSLRLMFYVLPVKHPAVTAVLAELGELRVEELRELFGFDEADEELNKKLDKLLAQRNSTTKDSAAYKKLSKAISAVQSELSSHEATLFWNLGKIYFSPDGDVKSIDLSRAHPALNSLLTAAGVAATADRGPSQLVGTLPPWAGWLYDQGAGESHFSGKDWRIHGKAAGYGQKIPLGAVDVRARIFLDDVLSLTFPYRTAEKLTQTSAQGDDSLLWSERPTSFSGTSTASKLKAKFAARAEAFDAEHESLLHELIPLLPESNRDAARAREASIITRAEAPAGSKRRGLGRKAFGADQQPASKQAKAFGSN